MNLAPPALDGTTTAEPAKPKQKASLPKPPPKSKRLSTYDDAAMAALRAPIDTEPAATAARKGSSDLWALGSDAGDGDGDWEAADAEADVEQREARARRASASNATAEAHLKERPEKLMSRGLRGVAQAIVEVSKNCFH
jgi:hypothetical protein